MNEDERYLVRPQCNGYFVVRKALGADEVAECNRAIEHHSDDLTEIDQSLAGGSKALEGTSHRLGLGGMLAWERPWCEPFRHLLVHPSIAPYLNVILGERYRLDHGPGLIAMQRRL